MRESVGERGQVFSPSLFLGRAVLVSFIEVVSHYLLGDGWYVTFGWEISFHGTSL